MSPSAVSLVRLAAINGLVAVALGAFGAHTLRDRISPEMLAIWKTGTDYHLSHALALLLTALICDRFLVAGNTVAANRARGAGLLFAVGILIFSGSLYALATTGLRVLGAITPLGGLCFLSGWLLLLFAPKSVQK
ncbi:MAG: DUF423 domain-containing protein [Capsulimonadales bacterium]|nr:DUF423 domain-containing protein [Capsulimonadales bacterium]